MKSKSPFTIKSPLRVQTYGGDTYESPDTVITKTVGEQVGKAITGLADNATKYMDLKGKLAYDKKNPKTKSRTEGGDTTNINNYFGREDNLDSDSTRTEISEKQGGGGFRGQSAKDLLGRKLTSEESKWKNKEVERLGGVQQYRDYYKIGEEKDKFHTRTTSKYKNDKKISSTTRDLLKNPISMNGSPVKHNAGAVGSIGNADSLAGGVAGIGQRISNQAQQRAAKSQQSGSGIFGTIAQAASQGGSVVGSIGQQMGNQAQQRAADAGGSTGVDPFLPPPNQVAETGSYGDGGDRDMLEMDKNKIDNQSIGRNTDITSQLFGSGQRASMLAMKGTPLHTEGHGGAKDHKHSPESRNSVTPKWKNGVNPYGTADKSISSIDEPRRLKEGEIGAPTEREQSDRDDLAKFDMEYKASGGNLYVPQKR
jgi:hypothetical protein